MLLLVHLWTLQLNEVKCAPQDSINNNNNNLNIFMQDCCFSFKKKTAINAGPVELIIQELNPLVVAATSTKFKSAFLHV